MCGKGTNKTTTTAPPAYIASAQQGLINQAQDVSKTPYTPYTGQLTAGFTPTQTAASSSLANIGPLSSSDIEKYLSPYTQNVVNATQANINETNAEQQNALRGNAISSGAWGGDRAGVAAAELTRQQNLAGQQTIAGLYNQGYGQAVSTAQNQQGFDLQKALSQFGIGTAEQQSNQAGLSAAYQQFLNQQQYPFATTSYLSNIINSSAPGAGSTTTEHTPGNLIGDLFGSAATILGTPTGSGSTVGSSLYNSFASGGSVGHGNVISMGDALRALPPDVLAKLHARMSSHPMMRQTLANGGIAGGDIFAAPYLPVPQNFVQSQPLHAPQTQQGDQGGGFGDTLKSMASLAMLFAKNGGAIKGYADGGLPYSGAPNADAIDLSSVPSLASLIAPDKPVVAPPLQAPANNNATPAPSVASLNGTTGGSSWADDAANSPLLNFGLATLAGSNDPGASAIGRGGMSALAGVATRRKAELDAALEREQLRGAGTENSLKDLQLKAYQSLANMDGSGAAPAASSAVDGHVNSLMNDATAGDALAPNAAPAQSRSPAGSPSGPAPLLNRADLLRRYTIASRTPGMEGLATQLLSAMNQGVPEGYYLGQDGGVYPRPGYLEGVGAKATATAQADAQARAAFAPPSFTPTHDAMGNPLSFNSRTGKAEPIAGSGTTGPLSLGDFATRITAPESGGDPNAKNPNSSATGSAQFLDGTWLNLLKTSRPDVAKGQTDAQLLAMRSDPALSSEMTQVYAKQNADVLDKAGVPVTAAALYLAHHFGSDGALKIAMAPEAEPLTNVLPPNVLKANPYLQNMTAGDLTRRIAGQVGTEPVNVHGGGTAASALAPADNSPASVDTVAKAIAHYQLAPLSGLAMRSPWGQSVMAKVADLNPDYNAGQFASRNRAMAAFATGPQGNTVRSFNVGLAHLGTLSDLAKALQGGDVQGINRIKNSFRSQFGSEVPTDFNAVRQIVGAEIVKAVTGASGALGDREEAAASFNAANSPEQLAGVIKHYKDLMTAQLGGLRRQYETSTGLHDFYDKLSPDAIQQMGMPVGAIYKGYAYQGGDMHKPTSWKKVQP